MKNVNGRNRKSPVNEKMYIKAYLKKNPIAKKSDGLDISSIISKSGEKGHGLLPTRFNRSHDNDYHRVKDFILDTELRINN